MKGSGNSDLERVDALLRAGGLTPRRRRTQAGWSGFSRGQERAEIRPQAAKRVVKSRVEIVRTRGWNAWPWLVHGFSTRTGGVTTAYRPGQRAGELNLGFTQTVTPENVEENRQRFLEAIGAPEMELVTLKQIHSPVVKRVASASVAATQGCQGDGLMTAEPGLLLAIQTADCIPVLVADVRQRAVGAFHAGDRKSVV